jgi:plasmid stabilization system protein ParE
VRRSRLAVIIAHLTLTRRALRDIRSIQAFSIETWGVAVADEYLDAIEAALDRLRENPQLLRTKKPSSDSLCFYRIRQHFLVRALFEKRVFVLAVKHGAMDLPSRIAELEPQLLIETEMLHKAYAKKRL